MSRIQGLNKNQCLLKWPGGKSKICDKLYGFAGDKKTLIEPFVGSASVFLNIGEMFDKYIGIDNNSDLILLFNEIKKDPHFIIKESRKLFEGGNNATAYYSSRKLFNELDRSDPMRAAHFVYLNRHGYNGLCRYGIRKGNYNVPFGDNSKVYFPHEEILNFHRMSNEMESQFICDDFAVAFHGAEDAFIYADPPFIELSKTSSFKNYSGMAYTHEDDERLDLLATEARGNDNICVVSNHMTDKVFDLYKGSSEHVVFSAKRNISCKKTRKPVEEVLIVYN